MEDDPGNYARVYMNMLDRMRKEAFERRDRRYQRVYRIKQSIVFLYISNICSGERARELFNMAESPDDENLTLVESIIEEINKQNKT